MKRTTCAACTGTDLESFLDLGESPLANRYPDTPDRSETRYPLALVRCVACTLVQSAFVVPDSEIYDESYGFYSGGSAPQRAYHRSGAELLIQRYGADVLNRGVVEVACNDGSLLEHFRDAGYPALGIDPAPGPVAAAKVRGLRVMEAPLTVALARDIREAYGPAGLVIAYNSMAHVADLGEILTAIRTLMDASSVAVFEVQYLPDMIAGNMYDQVYHEHRFFYSLASLRAAALTFGLYVVDAELIELQNGGLRVTLTRDESRHPPSSAVWRICRRERWVDTFTGFQGIVERTRDHLVKLLCDEKRCGRTVGGYGASAKATTIMNFCGLGPETIDFVVDTTPYKQGRYVPGTCVPIVAPADAPERHTLLLLAANYLGVVLRDDFHRGRWIVPQPVPVII